MGDVACVLRTECDDVSPHELVAGQPDNRWGTISKARHDSRPAHARRGRVVFRERTTTHLLLSFLKVEQYELVIRKATLGESQSDTIGVGRTTRAVESKGGHSGAVQ